MSSLLLPRCSDCFPLERQRHSGAGDLPTSSAPCYSLALVHDESPPSSDHHPTEHYTDPPSPSAPSAPHLSHPSNAALPPTSASVNAAGASNNHNKTNDPTAPSYPSPAPNSSGGTTVTPSWSLAAAAPPSTPTTSNASPSPTAGASTGSARN